MIINYQGYLAKVEFDDKNETFHGEVQNLRDVITFQAKTAKELKISLKESIEDYINWCHKRKKEPQKPFSGKFVLRISPELHKAVFTKAQQEDKSINQWIVEKLKKLAA